MVVAQHQLARRAAHSERLDPAQFPLLDPETAVGDDGSDLRECRLYALAHVRSAADDLILFGAGEQLRRVMNNLIGNAVKYRGNKDHGIIEVSLLEEEHMVRVEVKDNGQGISKEALPYVFERFYRADTSRNSKQGGSGLGLAIAKKIIEEHEGTICAESEAGVGTTIVFTLKKVATAEKKGVKADV